MGCMWGGCKHRCMGGMYVHAYHKVPPRMLVRVSALVCGHVCLVCGVAGCPALAHVGCVLSCAPTLVVCIEDLHGSDKRTLSSWACLGISNTTPDNCFK
eukprot:149341-Alexandrium_andersonii.AAC.1